MVSFVGHNLASISRILSTYRCLFLYKFVSFPRPYLYFSFKSIFDNVKHYYIITRIGGWKDIKEEVIFLMKHPRAI